jgi:SPP1 gp7 family putative phage head morphogenesis protein
VPKKNKDFEPSAIAEQQFARSLRKVARHSGHIVEAHVHGAKIAKSKEMQEALENYARIIDPWAKRQAAKMLEKVAKKTKKGFANQSLEMKRLLNTQVKEQTIGDMVDVLMNEQVFLIKSIPIRAGQRAQKLASEAFFNGTRAAEIAEELQRTTRVSESDAMRIARTETARANALIVEARASAVGSKAYIWRTSKDEAVRDSHKNMEGEESTWENPPHLSDGDSRSSRYFS